MEAMTLENAGDGAILVTSGSLTVRDAVFSQNHGSSGGAISCDLLCERLTVRRSTLTRNSARHEGGAIAADGGTGQPRVEITESTFTDNSAEADGGAISCLKADLSIGTSEFSSNEAARDGGAVFVQSGSVSIQRSAFASNDALERGGGVFWDQSSSTQPLSVIDSTLFQNSANTGGALHADGAGPAEVSFSTLVDNVAFTKAADIEADGTGSFGLGASILTHLTQGENVEECGGGQSRSMRGTDNLTDEDGDCDGLPGFRLGSLSSGSLSSFGLHGGPTPTLQLLSGSNAIDAISPFGASCLDPLTALPVLVDQRGQARPTGKRCDVGAFELR